MKLIKKRSGVSLVEVMLAMALVVIFIGAFYSLFFTNETSIEISRDQEQAVAYAQEGLEIVENIASDDFSNLVDGTYILSESSGEYSLGTGTETLESFFTRTVDISSATRNDSNQLDENGSNVDSQTKRVTITVSWNRGGVAARSAVLERYITDWAGVTWTQTTLTSFAAGTENSTQALASDLSIPDNGKVELSTAVGSSTYFGTANVSERAKNIDYEDGIAYVAVAKTSAGLCAVDIADPENVSVLECIDIEGKGMDVVKDGDYLYLAVDDSSDGLAIVEIEFDGGNFDELDLEDSHNIGARANRLDIQGNHAYVAAERSNRSLAIVNISDPDDPFTVKRINAGAYGRSIEVEGNYAYLGLSDGDLRIYDISNPNSPSLESTLTLSGSLNGAVLDGSYLYVSSSDSSNGLYVVNVANVSSPFVVNSYNFGYGSMDLDIFDDVLYMAAEDNHGGAVIYDISNPLSLPSPTSIDINGKGNGVKATDGFIYIATDTANQGLAIITQSTTELNTSGEFTSSIHDTGGENHNFKNISWLASVPPGTTLAFQIRTTDNDADIDLEPFVGPDGTDATYYSTSPGTIQLDPGRPGERFIQWRAYFTGDSNATPSVEEVNITYD